MISGLASATAQDAQVEDDGLPESFRRAYESHVDFVWRNLRRLGVPDGDIEDAVQETFVVAYRRRASFRSGASPRAWLYGIVRRIASRFRRGAMRRGRLHLAVAGAADSGTDLALAIERRDAWRIVEQFVVGLPDDKRDVFVLAELEGMTGNEIATLLRINPNTVGSRLRAGRGAFARYLETMSARERGARFRLERSTMLDAGRRAPGPDRQRRAAVGSALALQIGSQPSTWWATAAGLRAFLLTVGLGTAGVITTAVALPEDDAPTTVASRGEPADAGERARGGAADTLRTDASPLEAPAPALADVATTSTLDQATAPMHARANTPSRARATRSSSDPQPASSTPEPTPDRLLAEATALKQINRSVQRGEHREALRLLDIHARDFPHGTLAAEATALRTMALCALGRDDDAQRSAAALRKLAPHHHLANGCAREEKSTNPAPAGEAPGI